MSALALSCRDATCADARRLARWIDARGVSLAVLTESQQRTLQRWRHGGQARLGTVDAILVALGLTLHDVPDDVWRPYDNGRRGLCAGRRADD
jgi:hypothetical protein